MLQLARWPDGVEAGEVSEKIRGLQSHSMFVFQFPQSIAAPARDPRRSATALPDPSPGMFGLPALAPAGLEVAAPSSAQAHVQGSLQPSWRGSGLRTLSYP